MKQTRALYLIIVGLSLGLILTWKSKIADKTVSGPAIATDTPMAPQRSEPIPEARQQERRADQRQTINEVDQVVPKQREIPPQYRLPELPIGITYREFLAQYWGEAGRDYMDYLETSKWGAHLDNVNSHDWNKGVPIGTIEDYFVGLEERTVARFHENWDHYILEPPHIFGGSYAEPAALLNPIIASKVYNPDGKKVPQPLNASLLSLIEEQSSLPDVLAEDIIQRWVEIIRIDVPKIVNYEDPPHGKVFISPLVALTFKTEPNVATTNPYPVLNISLPGPRRDLVDTAAGFFDGWLTVWAGSDTQLAYLYDELSSSNAAFEASIKDFFSNI